MKSTCKEVHANHVSLTWSSREVKFTYFCKKNKKTLYDKKLHMMRSTINSVLILSLLHLGAEVRTWSKFVEQFLFLLNLSPCTKLALIVHFGILMNLRDLSNTGGRWGFWRRLSFWGRCPLITNLSQVVTPLNWHELGNFMMNLYNWET